MLTHNTSPADPSHFNTQRTEIGAAMCTDQSWELRASYFKAMQLLYKQGGRDGTALVVLVLTWCWLYHCWCYSRAEWYNIVMLGQNPEVFILVRLDTAAASAHRSSVTISRAVTIATHHLAPYLNIYLLFLFNMYLSKNFKYICLNCKVYLFSSTGCRRIGRLLWV